MEIFSYVEPQGPDYIAFMTDAGRVLTWVPLGRKWCVHIHGESWLKDTYLFGLDNALRRIAVPHDKCIDMAAHLREIHGCDPFEVPNGN
jgi:hypothetical protein